MRQNLHSILDALGSMMLWAPLVVGVLLLIVAIRGDRAKGRRRCPKCWHTMVGIRRTKHGWVCPECGNPATTTRDILRTRPRPFYRRLGVLLLLIAPLPWYGTRVIERWTQEGALALVPTTIAALAYPDHVSSIRKKGSIAQRADAMLANRYTELWTLHRWLAGTPESDFVPYDPMAYIDIPDVWVRNDLIPIFGDRLYDRFAQAPLHLQDVELRGQGVNYFLSTHGLSMPNVFPRRTRIRVVEVQDDQTVLRFDVTHTYSAQQTRYASQFENTVTESHAHTIRIVDSWGEMLDSGLQPSISDPSIDGWLRSVPQVLVGLLSDRVVLYSPVTSLNGMPPPPFETIFAYDVVLMEGDQELGRSTVTWNQRVWSPMSWDGFVNSPELTRSRFSDINLKTLLDEPERWSIRLVPRPRLAIEVDWREPYWMPWRRCSVS